MTERRTLANKREHNVVEFDHGGQHYIAGAGFSPDGSLAEIFLSCAKAGSQADDAARDAAITASIGLQHGVPLNVLRRALTRAPDGSASGPLCRALDLFDATGYAA